MLLKRLSLSNFKGIRSFDLNAGGGSVSIFADNGVGKSSLMDAYLWCLFGKDGRGQAKFDIKTIVGGEPLHNVNHTVEAVLVGPKGEYTFTRTYREVYTQKRGSVTDEFSGHTTDYRVNGVPVDERAYQAEVASICPEATFRLLSDPFYFASIPWRDRRAMLMKAFAPDVTDDVVIESTPSLIGLRAVLGRYTVEQYKEVAAAQRKKINDQLKGIPARIDELNRTLRASAPAPSDVDIDSLRTELDTEQRKRAEIVAGAGGADISVKLSEIDAEMVRYESNARRAYDEANEAVLRDQRALRVRVEELRGNVAVLDRRIASEKAESERTYELLQNVRDEWSALAKEAYPAGNDLCPTCGQNLPADRIEAARALFNENLAGRKADCEARGKALRKQCVDFDARIQELYSEWTAVQEEFAKLQAEISAFPAVALFSLDKTDPGWIELVDRKNALMEERTALKSSVTGKVADIDARIRDLQQQISAAERAAEAGRQRAETEQRIKQLQEDEKNLQGEFELIMYNLGLAEQFDRARASLLTDRVNQHFAIARFRLFTMQVNGGLAECCDIVDDQGVSWDGGINTAKQINIGLDIINTFTKALGVEPMPIFVDRAESVTQIIETDGQQIRLIVSAADKELRVEGGTGSTTTTTQKELF
jgi:hypothetical protein